MRQADDTTKLLTEIAKSEATTRRSILARLGPAAAAGGLVALGQPLAAQAAVTDSLFDRGGAVFNVKAFGAAGNGSTDDTAAINSAIAAAVSAQGGTVYFPQGNFVISSTLTLSTRGVHLIGAGRHATVISASAGFRSGDMILIGIEYCSVKHMTLSGGATFRAGGAGVHINGPSAGAMNEMAASHWVQDLNMYQQFIGILIDGLTYMNYVDGIYMYPLAANGFGIVVNTTTVTGASVFISNVYVNGGSTSSASQPEAAIRIQHVGDYTLRSFASVLCRNGLVVDPSDNDPNYGVQAGMHEACFFDTMSVRCIHIQPTNGALVRLLQFTSCWGLPERTTKGVLISGNVTSAQFTGCMFHANLGHGFSCLGDGQTDQRIFLDACEALGNDRSFIGEEKAGFVFENTRNFAIRGCSTGQGYQFDLQFARSDQSRMPGLPHRQQHRPREPKRGHPHRERQHQLPALGEHRARESGGGGAHPEHQQRHQPFHRERKRDPQQHRQHDQQLRDGPRRGQQPGGDRQPDQLERTTRFRAA